jgi:dihydroorotate dehydrogenase electron transfer subunit
LEKEIMIQQAVKVLWNKKLSTAYYKIGVACCDHYSSAKPGQFVMLGLAGQAEPLLRRPFSIHHLLIENGIPHGLELLYKVVGATTAALAQRKPGDIVDIFGPLGSGFFIPSQAKRVFVVAGGVGVAPLLFLVYDLHRKNADLSNYRVFIGGRTKEDLLCRNEFLELGVSVLTTTDDGSAGDQCLVTHPLENAMGHTAPDVIVACGPMDMLACVVGIAEKHKVPCQVSIETMMACGMGACLGCAVESRIESDHYLHACMDGPVFSADMLKF